MRAHQRGIGRRALAGLAVGPQRVGGIRINVAVGGIASLLRIATDLDLAVLDADAEFARLAGATPAPQPQ
jgi:hypothetical protein